MIKCPDCDIELVETTHTKGLYECPKENGGCEDEFLVS